MHQPVFDSHLHIIDPHFPLVENNGYVPDPFTVSDYQHRVDGLHIFGGAVVAGSFQGFHQEYLISALKQLGSGFVGVAQIPNDTTDTRIVQLHDAGVRALRFNIARGGAAALADLETLARRVYDLVGWHAELYIDARTIDDDLFQRIARLPTASIDHLGMHEDGLNTLLRLVEKGVKVKATGFGRVDLDPARTMRAILDVDPTALMVGTDLPSTRARRPVQNADFELITETLTSEEIPAVLWDNAADFYLRQR